MAGLYVTAGNGTTHAETTVDAANTLTLVSGRDTTLEGAQARGETVIADIGRNLTMTSQQDTNDYARKDQSAGIDAAFGTGGGQVSASYNQSKIDSTYTSVKEQTGIQAGEGGFDIRVGGHTQLNGAAIASAADPSRNRLETGSLGWSDLENEAEYKASSFGISASGGSGGGSVSPNISVPQHEKSGSTTQAGIADGTLIVHDGSGEGIARGVTELQQDGLKEIFDQQKVAERMEMGQVAGQVGFTAAKDLISWRQDVAAEELREAREGANAAAESNDPEAIALAKQRLQAAQAEYGKWDEGGAMKRGTQVVTGMLVAAAGGGDVGAAAMGVMANEVLLSKVSAFLNQKGVDSGSTGHELAMALTGAVGSAAGGAIAGDVMSGAAAGTTAQVNGYYGYRDGSIKAERELSGILEEFAAANPDVSAEQLAGLEATLLGTLKMGATTADLLAIASTPGYLAEMTVASAVQALAIARYGKDFDALDEQQRRSIAEDFMRYGQIGDIENLSNDGSVLSVGQRGQEVASAEPDWQTKVGTAFSDLIVSGQRGTERAVNWLGEDNATAAGMAIMVALGGPVKTGMSMAFSASPAGKAVENVKGQIKGWLTPVNGTYLFGANTDAQQNGVRPASEAVAGTTVELGSSLLGVSMASSIKGIIGLSKGFGAKVDAAGSQSLLDPKATTHILDGDGPTSGGHRFGTGLPGKSEFPQGWSDQKITNVISDIATDPKVKWSKPDVRGYVTGSATRDGIDVKVVYDTKNGRIVTGFPTNTPKNPKP